jgi:hypothetical protein
VAQTQYREPIDLVAGDTLSFSRKLGDYLAGDGWSLTYELRGGAQAIEFSSTANGADHVLLVAAAVTATWLPAEYILAGYAIKGAERHQIYLGTLSVTENLQAAAGNVPEQTFAQKMVNALEAVMLGKAANDLTESTINETRFRYLTPEQLRIEHGYWLGVRRNEVAAQRARAGLPTGNKIRPRMCVKGQGSMVGGGVWPYS